MGRPEIRSLKKEVNDMANYEPVSCRVTLRLDGGTNDNGNAVTKSVSISKINPSVGAEALAGAGDELETLLEFPRKETLKVVTERVKA